MLTRKTGLLCLVLLLSAHVSHGEPVSIGLEKGLLGGADYLEGRPDKTAVLLLHGFLQTQHFRTIQRLAEALGDEGYSVLSPTLSLGIPLRQESLACEAIHTHTLQDAHSEITAWIAWLQARGHTSIVLVGHSTGSVVLLSYLHEHPPSNVTKLIGISLVESKWDLGDEQHAQLLSELHGYLEHGENPLMRRPFSFCQSLRATARCLLSYLEWTPARILHAIEDIPTEQVLILGSRDERLGANWLEELRGTGKSVYVIEGANHFMDGEFEFELLDRLLVELR